MYVFAKVLSILLAEMCLLDCTLAGPVEYLQNTRSFRTSIRILVQKDRDLAEIRPGLTLHSFLTVLKTCLRSLKKTFASTRIYTGFLIFLTGFFSLEQGALHPRRQVVASIDKRESRPFFYCKRYPRFVPWVVASVRSTSAPRPAGCTNELM